MKICGNDALFILLVAALFLVSGCAAQPVQKNPAALNPTGLQAANMLSRELPGGFTIITGEVKKEGGKFIVAADPIFSYGETNYNIFEQIPKPPPDNLFHIDFLGEKGRLLSSAKFYTYYSPYPGADYDEQSGKKPGYFVQAVYMPNQTKEIYFYRGKELMRKIIRSPSFPMITEFAPDGGNLSEPTTITWKGFDADGDSLTYELGIMENEGVSGSPLIIPPASTTSYSLNPDSFDIERGRMSLVVSDGANSARFISKPFFFPVKPVRVAILLPGSETEFRGMVVTLTAFVEGGGVRVHPCKNCKYVWESDVYGFLGDGTELVCLHLASGKHTVTLKVTTPSGATGIGNVSFAYLSPFEESLEENVTPCLSYQS